MPTDHPLDEPITGMTYRELRALIAAEVRAQLANITRREVEGYLQEPDPEKAAEAVRWLREHKFEAPPGAPSVVDMIREDRDR